MEEALNFVEHDVSHNTLMLKTDFPSSHWRIARMATNSTKRQWVMQANTKTLYNAKDWQIWLLRTRD